MKQYEKEFLNNFEDKNSPIYKIAEAYIYKVEELEKAQKEFEKEIRPKIRKDKDSKEVIACACKQNLNNTWSQWIHKGDMIAYDVYKNSTDLMIGRVDSFEIEFGNRIVWVNISEIDTPHTIVKRTNFFEDIKAGLIRKIYK